MALTERNIVEGIDRKIDSCEKIIKLYKSLKFRFDGFGELPESVSIITYDDRIVFQVDGLEGLHNLRRYFSGHDYQDKFDCQWSCNGKIKCSYDAQINGNRYDIWVDFDPDDFPIEKYAGKNCHIEQSTRKEIQYSIVCGIDGNE